MGERNETGFSFGRRVVLKLLAAAGALAGCSPRPDVEKLVPYLVPPEHAVPGEPLEYRTLCRECAAGCGVTAATQAGRAVKLEGNPDDPIGRGALCARGQAAVQALYDPERASAPLRRAPDGRLAPITWDEAVGQLAAALAAAKAKGRGRIRLLTRPEPGSAGVVQRAFLHALGAGAEHRVVFDPLDPAPLRAASKALFGRPEIPAHDLGAARAVVSFGAELLETWISPVELTRGFAQGRGQVGPERPRFTWIGPRLSLTGASADRWLSVRPGGELAVALGLLRFITDPSRRAPGLAPEAPSLFRLVKALSPAELAARAGTSSARIAALGVELVRKRPSALLGPGLSSQGTDATALAAVILLLNHVLGNVGRTLLYGLDPLDDPPSSPSAPAALVEEMAAGRVDVLLVHHADLLGWLPPALGADRALTRVPLVASFADRPDATRARAHLVLPDHHPLESFGDVAPRRGVVLFGQPVMTPLGDTRAASQVLIDVAARPPLGTPLPFDGFGALVRERAERLVRAHGAGAPVVDSVREAFQRGVVTWEVKPAVVSLRVGAAEPFLAPPPSPPGAALELVVFPTPLRAGAAADRPGWLREVPDALTTLSWIGWAELSPATAARLGVATGDRLALATAAGGAELPAYVYPGILDGVVAVPLGGRDPLALLGGARDPRSGALAWRAVLASAARAGPGAPLPRLEGSAYTEGRRITRTVTPAEPALPRPSGEEAMYGPPEHPKHRWSMAIDLDRCTGCQACVVACFAENNVPVMGPQAAAEGRYMGWIRVERYFGSEPGELDVELMLMLCQHCANAPCEPVCPVYATYHTAEGLNAQVYNRCVGTRYCSNNCPYKVRTFNWRDPEFAPPLHMQLNPDVAVRSKGVMEKCTFCVQRIRRAEHRARREGRALADGDIVPACAQACPARAIVFGDAKDPASRVSALRRDPRGFAALDELNTQPAITYLARVRSGR